MKHVAMGWFSAVIRSARVTHAATRTDTGAPSRAGRRSLLELQWRGRGGRFRHLALRPPGSRRVLGTLGIVVLLGLAFGVAGTFSGKSKRPPAQFGVGAILREHAGLKARHDALRERAFDLAEQLYARVEQGRRMVRRASTAGGSWTGQCPRPPARDAEDEAIFTWLAEQGARLEAIGDELTAGRVETGVMQASTLTPVSTRAVPMLSAGMSMIAASGSGRGLAAAPAKR